MGVNNEITKTDAVLADSCNTRAIYDTSRAVQHFENHHQEGELVKRLERVGGVGSSIQTLVPKKMAGREVPDNSAADTARW